jgi:N-acetyl-anhydromuramyl-L-alanine amidase AmpD
MGLLGLSIGSSNEDVKLLQKAFGLPEDGIFDGYLEAAIKNLQIRGGLSPTGNINEQTADLINSRVMNLNLNISPNVSKNLDVKKEKSVDSDMYSTDLKTSAGLNIKKYFLPEVEYVKSETPKKEYIFLHHTAGWNNPKDVIDQWASDDRGKIGVHYVIGGINIKNDDDTYDGKIYQAIPDNYYAYHLGGYDKYKIDPVMHKKSIGIEICNFGGLNLIKGKYYTWSGQIVKSDYIIKLDKKFRDFTHFHAYTTNQIQSLLNLILYLSKKYSINIDIGLKNFINKNINTAFEWNTECVAGHVHGLLSHSNVRKDKGDIFPQPELVNMIASL